MTSPPPKVEGAGRGRGGFGGGGFGRGGRGGAAEAPPRRTPEGSLAAELEQAPTVGYVWSSEVAGYAIRYAGKVMATDGTERIILVTGRRLGANTNLWKPVGNAPPSTYEFSVIELHVNSKGTGEDKISLTGKVVLDNAAKMVVPENYAALPVVIHNLKRSSGEID